MENQSVDLNILKETLERSKKIMDRSPLKTSEISNRENVNESMELPKMNLTPKKASKSSFLDIIKNNPIDTGGGMMDTKSVLDQFDTPSNNANYISEENIPDFGTNEEYSETKSYDALDGEKELPNIDIKSAMEKYRRSNQMQQPQKPKLTQHPSYGRTNISKVEEHTYANNGIDYSMIKMIVEDTIRKYMSAFTKKIINEGKTGTGDNLKLFRIGDSFQFLTKDGDLYKAKLTFIKNVNK
jgi:hypothetical protein